MDNLFKQLDLNTQRKIQFLLQQDKGFRAVGIVLLDDDGNRATIDMGKVTRENKIACHPIDCVV